MASGGGFEEMTLGERGEGEEEEEEVVEREEGVEEMVEERGKGRRGSEDVSQTWTAESGGERESIL
jgi:hypothetical protein